MKVILIIIIAHQKMAKPRRRMYRRIYQNTQYSTSRNPSNVMELLQPPLQKLTKEPGYAIMTTPEKVYSKGKGVVLMDQGQ